MNERAKLLLLGCGAFLTVAGLAVLVCVAALNAVAGRRGADGYVMAAEARYGTATYALASERLDLGSAAADWATRPGAAASIRVRVRSERPTAIFAGIAPAGDAARYLEGVSHETVLRAADATVVYRRESGSRAPSPPARSAFWSAAVSGSGTQTLNWDVRPGRWTLVVMNADASPVVDVALRPGIKAGWIDGFARALAIPGALAFVLGWALVLYGGMLPLETRPIPSGFGTGLPVSVEATLDEPLSRWLWLVKWLLAIPHAIVLFFLWPAFAMITVAAFFSIAFTGRYPVALFATNVGILRWSWRVGFYAYSALATDRYPPFTLRDVADYPAHLDVAYPEHLSRGLALVKWWLLAIPHYLIIAIFSGTSRSADPNGGVHANGGLLPLLVLFAGVALLFTGRYPRGLFDLIVGLHRWIYRVTTYVCLMHDVYPPFRVDLGGGESSTTGPSPIVAARA